MPDIRPVHVHLLPALAPEGCLAGGIAVVIDVLRATTTIVHALAAGCTAVQPCAEIEEAKALADSMRAGRVLLAGERGGQQLPGFDLGNSPGAFTPRTCCGCTLVLTTTNGTRALLRAAEAQRTLVAAFVNFSAVCEQLRQDPRPIHILCAGTDGEVSLEDTLLAGALVDFLSQASEVELRGSKKKGSGTVAGTARRVLRTTVPDPFFLDPLNDAARLAWDCFENHGRVLQGAMEVGRGGAILRRLGYDDDIRAACQVDRFHLVPELKRDPLRIEVGAVGIVQNHWR